MYLVSTMTLTADIRHIRGRIAEVGTRQADLADAIGMHETLLNAILRGRREAPEGFEERVHTALDQIEEEQRVAREAVQKLRAERAAQEARERVLDEEAE